MKENGQFKEYWKSPFSEEVLVSSPSTVVHDKVVLPFRYELIYFNLLSGETLWKIR